MLWFIHCIAGVDDRRGYVIFGRADQFGQFEVAPACDFWPRQAVENLESVPVSWTPDVNTLQVMSETC